MKFSRPFGLPRGNGQSGDRPPFLATDQVSALPEWNPVVVSWAGEKTSKGGNQILLVIYRDLKNSWVVSQRYMPVDDGLAKALSVWGITGGVEEPGELSGRAIDVKFKVNGSYVNIVDYQASTGGQPQQQVDEVPF